MEARKLNHKNISCELQLPWSQSYYEKKGNRVRVSCTVFKKRGNCQCIRIHYLVAMCRTLRRTRRGFKLQFFGEKIRCTKSQDCLQLKENENDFKGRKKIEVP